MSRTLIVVGLIVALLVATNPSRDDFNAWAQVFAKHKIEQEAKKRGEPLDESESALGGALAGLILAHMPIERTNLLVFSVYHVTLPAGYVEDNECRILGIAGQFLPLGDC